jgi:hypothetical protein
MLWNVVAGATGRKGLLIIEKNFLAGGHRRSYEDENRHAATKKLNMRRFCWSRLLTGYPVFLVTQTLDARAKCHLSYALLLNAIAKFGNQIFSIRIFVYPGR